MGIIDYVVKLLNDGGIQANTAWPADTMILAQIPVAAVSIEEVDRKTCTATVLVEVVCNFRNSGAYCQKRALDAYEILVNAGAHCVQGKCSFDGQSGLFSVPVRATFYGVAQSDSWQPMAKPTVKLNEVQLEYFYACTAERSVDEEHSTLLEAPWQFTLEEVFPCGAAEPSEVQEPFTLSVICNGVEESYQNCVVTLHQRMIEETGIWQIRKGTASGRIIRTI